MQILLILASTKCVHIKSAPGRLGTLPPHAALGGEAWYRRRKEGERRVSTRKVPFISRGRVGSLILAQLPSLCHFALRLQLVLVRIMT